MGQLGFSVPPPNNPIYLWKPHIPPDSSGLIRAFPEVLRRPSGGPSNVIPGLPRAGSGRLGSVRFCSVRFGSVRLEARGNTGRRPRAAAGGGGRVRGGRMLGRRSILVHPGFDRAEISARAGGRDSSAAALCGFDGISEFRLIFRNPLSLPGWTKTPFLRIK